MKLKYGKFQILLEIIGIMVLLAFFIFIITSWGDIPERIPGHYNGLGEIDRWVSKSQILVPPIIGLLMYLGLTIITFFPKIWNVPSGKKEENKNAIYQCAKTMIIVLKVEIISAFFYITFHSANSLELPKAFLPIELFIIFGSLIFFTARSFYLGKK
ncbi:DUF1648 domain-containing protein [Clostridium sp.]|uniref:DUF1648 domain-containing protein n=1 Tax=Clostridium sp. TaxID=1506 RepID=UPI0034644298